MLMSTFIKNTECLNKKTVLLAAPDEVPIDAEFLPAHNAIRFVRDPGIPKLRLWEFIDYFQNWPEARLLATFSFEEDFIIVTPIELANELKYFDKAHPHGVLNPSAAYFLKAVEGYDARTLIVSIGEYSVRADYISDDNVLMFRHYAGGPLLLDDFVRFLRGVPADASIKALIYLETNIVVASEDIVAPVRQQVLEEAIKTINGPRNQDYGGPESSFATIAALWTTYLQARGFTEGNVEAWDVALMMDLMKTARLVQSGGRHKDSWVDKAGYSGCGAEVALC